MFKNENLEMKMIVKKDITDVECVVMKKSSITDGVFSVFFNFEVDEVVSVYLGESIKAEEKVEYVY